MDVTRARPNAAEKSATALATDERTIASERAGSQLPRNKQNLDYVLRTGLAGGLAGCAVGLHPPPEESYPYTQLTQPPHHTGQNGRWSS